MTLAANASDNVGVAGVQFLVNNIPLGAEDTRLALQPVGGTPPRPTTAPTR